MYVESKCLILNIDNRELNTQISANDYPSMSSVLNYHYAKVHDYDYIYIQNSITNFEVNTRKKYPQTTGMFI